MTARLAGACLCLALCLGACSPKPSADEQIRAAIGQLEAHGEKGERRAFMAGVADDFTAQQGSLSRDEFRALLIIQWNRYRRLSAQLGPISVHLTSDTEAQARFQALITGGQGLIPENGQLYDIRTRWRKVDGDWLLAGADWKPVLDGNR